MRIFFKCHVVYSWSMEDVKEQIILSLLKLTLPFTLTLQTGIVLAFCGKVLVVRWPQESPLKEEAQSYPRWIWPVLGSHWLGSWLPVKVSPPQQKWCHQAEEWRPHGHNSSEAPPHPKGWSVKSLWRLHRIYWQTSKIIQPKTLPHS